MVLYCTVTVTSFFRRRGTIAAQSAQWRQRRQLEFNTIPAYNACYPLLVKRRTAPCRVVPLVVKAARRLFRVVAPVVQGQGQGQGQCQLQVITIAATFSSNWRSKMH